MVPDEGVGVMNVSDIARIRPVRGRANHTGTRCDYHASTLVEVYPDKLGKPPLCPTKILP